MKNILLFFLFLVSGGFYCALVQQEVGWDFLNYHYYNGWAFWTGQTFKNIAPAGVHSYFNPLLDTYTYLLVSLFNHHPPLVFFGQGLWLGLLWFITLKLTLLILPHRTKWEKFSCAIAFFFSILCYSVMRQAGTSTNEVPIGSLFLTGCYLLLKYLYQTKQKSNLLLIGSGSILGIACSFKMTIIPSVLILGLLFLFSYRHLQNPIKSFLSWGCAGIFGYLLTNGFWIFLLWKHFKNPFFPFFNNIFKSPFALPIYIRDTYLDPPDIWGYIFLPWHLMKYNYATTDIMSRSFNIPLGLLAAVGSLFLKNRKPIHNFLIFFVLLGYLLWLLSTHMLRYAIPLEILSGILCVLWIIHFSKKIIPVCLICLLSVNITAALTYEPWTSFQTDHKPYIQVSSPPVAPDTVILVRGLLTSVLIPHIQGGSFVAGIDKKWRETQPETEISISGKLGSLFWQRAPSNPRFAIIYQGRENPHCTKIETNYIPDYNICPRAGSDGLIHGVPFPKLQEFFQ